MSEQNQGRPQGGSMLEQVKLLHNAPIKINKDFQMPKIRIQESNSAREYVCTCCGKSYTKQDGNFYKSSNSILWQANNGYIPICKTCAEAIYSALIDFYSGNEEHALHHWCGIFDYPYDLAASAMTAGYVQPGRSRLSLYPSKLNTKQVMSRGKTYLDTVRYEAGESNRIKTVNDIVASQEGGDQFIVTKEITKKWGLGLTPEEYEWLCEQEDDWRARVECKTKAQEELIRMICMAQLNAQKAQQGNGKATEAMKAFQELLAACNLQPRQNPNDDFTDQETFGTLIKTFENDRPIGKPDPEWEDVDGIKRYIDTWFLGHLCNLVHITNDNEEQYRKEIEKYTVTPPTYDNDEDAVDVSLLDKYSNKGDKPPEGNE